MGSVTSYHWRNAGGAIISLNALPTSADDGVYGETIRWTVSFHRRPNILQTFGVDCDPTASSYSYQRYKPDKISIDGNGQYSQYIQHNRIWQAMHSDQDLDQDFDGETQDSGNVYWYQPEQLTADPLTSSNWQQNFRNPPPAVVETYHFEWNINSQEMIIYDPEMKKMGRTDKDYTWRLQGNDRWHW